jgi:nucleoside-diphosphate-sugar epimerase
MRILITGGAGFLGSNLCSFLLNQGHQVTVVDNLITGTRSNLEEHRANPLFKFYELSIDDQGFLNEFTNLEQHRFDQVYHLACPTGVPNISTLGEEMMETCSTGTKQVLQVALLHQAKILFTSSSEIYGNPKIAPQTEDYTGNVDPRGPRAAYEEGKRYAETLVTLYKEKYGLFTIIVRLFNVYGPRMSLADTRVIPRFVTQALTGRSLTIHGDGSQERTMCYVDDIVRGLTLLMEQGQSGEVYNLGSDKSLTMSQLAEEVIKITNIESKIAYIPRASHDHDQRIPSLRKIRALGWRAATSLREGLRSTIVDFSARLGLSANTEEVPGYFFRPAR